MISGRKNGLHNGIGIQWRFGCERLEFTQRKKIRLLYQPAGVYSITLKKVCSSMWEEDNH